MRVQDIIAGIGLLILVYLVLVNWKGANALIYTSASAGNTMIRSLQGR